MNVSMFIAVTKKHLMEQVHEALVMRLLEMTLLKVLVLIIGHYLTLIIVKIIFSIQMKSLLIILIQMNFITIHL